MIKIFFILFLECFCSIIVYSQTTNTIYKVSKKETLYSIAKKYNISINDIIKANPQIKKDGLKANTFISIPKNKDFIIHIILKNETLYSISKKYNIPIEAILKNNQIQYIDKLQEGNTLKIPKQSNNINTSSTFKILVCLPLSSNKLEGKRSLEFIRGFLMALPIVSNEYINIKIIDETLNSNFLLNFKTSILEYKPNIIIGPVYPLHFDSIATLSKRNSLKLYLPFSSQIKNSKDTDKYIYLLNTPINLKYSILGRILNKISLSKNIYIIDNPLNINNQSLLIQNLENLFNIKEISKIDLLNLNIKEGIIISTNNNEKELQDLLDKVQTLQKKTSKTNLYLLGFSNWLNFQDIFFNDLCKSNTIIVTNHFLSLDNDNKKKMTNYEKIFNQKILDYSPNMFFLGYDLFKYIYNNDISNEKKTFDNYIQTNINFKQKNSESKFFNQSLFLIHFKPNYTIDKINEK